MKRDMDLIRKIVFVFEDSLHGYMHDRIVIEGYDRETIDYHSYLMLEAGLAQGSVVTLTADPSPNALIVALTSKGHDAAMSRCGLFTFLSADQFGESGSKQPQLPPVILPPLGHPPGVATLLIHGRDDDR